MLTRNRDNLNCLPSMPLRQPTSLVGLGILGPGTGETGGMDDVGSGLGLSGPGTGVTGTAAFFLMKK